MRAYRNPFLGAAPLAPAKPTEQQQLTTAARYAALLQPSGDALPVVLSSANNLVYPAAPNSVVLLTYVVPSGHTLVINKLAIVNVGVSLIDYSGLVIYRALRNGAGIRGYENLPAQLGTLANPQDVQIILDENEILTILATVPQGQAVPGQNVPAARAMGFLKLSVPWPNILPRG